MTVDAMSSDWENFNIKLFAMVSQTVHTDHQILFNAGNYNTEYSKPLILGSAYVLQDGNSEALLVISTT